MSSDTSDNFRSNNRSHHDHTNGGIEQLVAKGVIREVNRHLHDLLLSHGLCLFAGVCCRWSTEQTVHKEEVETQQVASGVDYVY